MKHIKTFEKYTAETKEAPTKPVTKPTTKPNTRPATRPAGKPSPIRRDEPSVVPGPKATVEKVVDRVYKNMDSELKKIIIDKYHEEL